MSDRIRGAARVIGQALATYHHDDGAWLWPQALEVARALDEAGVLAPDPFPHTTEAP